MTRRCEINIMSTKRDEKLFVLKQLDRKHVLWYNVVNKTQVINTNKQKNIDRIGKWQILKFIKTYIQLVVKDFLLCFKFNQSKSDQK